MKWTEIPGRVARTHASEQGSIHAELPREKRKTRQTNNTNVEPLEGDDGWREKTMNRNEKGMKSWTVNKVVWYNTKERPDGATGSLIDYRCEDGYIPVSASRVTIPKPNSLSTSETRIDARIRRWKKHLHEWARRQKAISGIYLTK
jgi:hypothetical protein